MMEGLVDYSDSDTDNEVEDGANSYKLSTTCKHAEQPESPVHGVSTSRDKNTNCSPPPAKRGRREDNTVTHKHSDISEPSQELVKEGCSASKPDSLSLPSAILDMFNEESESEPSHNHQGRVRSFAHVRGNWATHVFLPVELTNEISTCVNGFLLHLQKQFSNYQFHAVPRQEFHLSLSRTVPIQHHWIGPLMDSLRSKFKPRNTVNVGFGDIAFYTNDECTRSFVGIDLINGQEQVYSLVEDVNQCFSMYRLQEYYKNPSFHVSLYWCLGNILKDFTSQDKIHLQEQWEELLQLNMLQQSISLEITEVRCRTGNKIYSFPLSF